MENFIPQGPKEASRQSMQSVDNLRLWIIAVFYFCHFMKQLINTKMRKSLSLWQSFRIDVRVAHAVGDALRRRWKLIAQSIKSRANLW